MMETTSTNEILRQQQQQAQQQQQQQKTTTTAHGSGGGGGMPPPQQLPPMSGAMDTGGLTFGPAWLRQLSSGDSSKISALPPSPGLAFQLAKHRYGREEMLAIFEALEKQLAAVPAPANLLTDFDDLCKREFQRPISLTPISQEEQVIFAFFWLFVRKFLKITLNFTITNITIKYLTIYQNLI
jgi:hypothetical protein